MKSLRWASILISIYLVFHFLIIAKPYAIPLVLAGVVCFFIIEIAETYKRLHFKNWQMPEWLSLILSVSTLGLACWVLYVILNTNIHAVIAVAPEYKKKLLNIVNSLQTISIFQKIPLDINRIMERLDFTEIFKALAEIAKTIAENAIMIIIYSIFILLEYQIFRDKIRAIFKNHGIDEMIKSINSDIRKYVIMKSSINLLAALLAFGAMKAIGLDFAALWAMIIFLLHFIPVIGGVISFALPLLVSLVQFDGYQYFFITLASLGAIMLIIGHFLEPRLMGKSLNLSPLFILLSLVLWGNIWGVTGMLLCIPITVIAKIILSRFPSTQPIAIILSANGKLKD
jgi:AI-2 transport protein TqsA